jgi:hypothetical protein
VSDEEKACGAVSKTDGEAAVEACKENHYAYVMIRADHASEG